MRMTGASEGVFAEVDSAFGSEDAVMDLGHMLIFDGSKYQADIF